MYYQGSMKKSAYAAVVLAAGLSSRMKPPARPFKPLLEIGGLTLTDRLIALYRESGVEVVLVTGWQKEQLLAGINSKDVISVENPDFEKGMFTSIQAGLRRVYSAGYQAVFVHPVDIPLVRPYSVRRLLEAADSNPDHIIYPICSAKRGHPTLIPSTFISSILEWRGEGGLKAVLENHRELALDVAVPDDFIHCDIDTASDYAALLERFRGYRIPSASEIDVINAIFNVAEDRRRHCRKVEKVALILGESLAKAGKTVDLALVRAAAILHDLAKGRKDHAGAGAQALEEMGFVETGRVVAAHSDLPEGLDGSSLEAKIVFLADKFVAGETPVSVEQRYSLALERFAVSNTIRADIFQRQATALNVKYEFETTLGYPLVPELFFPAERH